jgi:hypothetical protein
MVWIRPSVPVVAVGAWIKTGYDRAAAPEVMPAGGDPNSWLLQDGRVKNCGFLDT